MNEKIMDRTASTRSLLPGSRPLKKTISFRQYLNNIFALRCMFYAFDVFVYFLGPLLVALALCITYGLCYTFYYILVPMMKSISLADNDNLQQTNILPLWVHECYVAWIAFNVIFNYLLCVISRKDRSGSKEYNQTVRELAIASGFRYPETMEDRNAWFVEWRRRRLYASPEPGLDLEDTTRVIITRSQQQPIKRTALVIPSGDEKDSTPIASNITSAPILFTADDLFDGHAVASLPTHGKNNTNILSKKSQKPRWMELSPYEWSYCYHSNLPKPPRAHYDHVTQSLILNMDHYCPWVFNTVGYYNYRYFVTFLIYVSIGMAYGSVMSYKPFILMDDTLFDVQKQAFKEWTKTNPVTTFRRIYPFVPLPSERAPITLSFILCLALGIAVMLLLAFHFYLILTAQTTIEFHGNLVKREECRIKKIPFKYPYSLGWKRNLQQIFGSGTIFTWLLPSARDPEYLPIPINGEKGTRHRIRCFPQISAGISAAENDILQV